MSLSFKAIVFPVDFSDRCRGAARHVEVIAGHFKSRVILLHVLESTIGQPGDLDFGGLAASLQWEERMARAEDMIRTFLDVDLGRFEVERRVETGDPARTIIRVARESEADLIMMPTHGYGPFRRFLLGSVAAKVLHDADCAVWTAVHMENAPPVDEIHIRRILCALDVAEDNSRIVGAAADFAGEFGAELAFCHAVPGSDSVPERLLDCELRRHLMAQAREQLQEMLGRIGLNAGVIVESGEIARVVDSAARSCDADLVLIGRSRHHGFARLRTHSYAIIRESPCPVLSI